MISPPLLSNLKHLIGGPKVILWQLTKSKWGLNHLTSILQTLETLKLFILQVTHFCQDSFIFQPRESFLPSPLALVVSPIRMERHWVGLRFPYFVPNYSIWVVRKCLWLKVSICFSRIIGISPFLIVCASVGRNQDNSAFWNPVLGSCCIWGAWKNNRSS